MPQLKSLAVGLLAIVATAPAASAIEIDSQANNLPAANLQAQVKVNIGIGINTDPAPQRVYYPQPQVREKVIVVERNVQTTYYNGNDRDRSEWRGRKKGWYKNGKYKYRDRDDD